MLDSVPELSPHLVHVWELFQELHEERPATGRSSPIPTTELLEGLRIRGIGERDLPWYFERIRPLDMAWVERERDNVSAAVSSADSGGPKGPPSRALGGG